MEGKTIMIPHFKLVEADRLGNIWRGGQPETFDELLNLKPLGVRQVIKLNSPSDAEKDWCKRAGFELFECPITLTEQIITEPNLQAVRDAVGFVGPGTFVHCEHGEDRTGLVVALYRIKTGWTKDQAWAEMKENQFHSCLMGLDKAWVDLTR
jgi:protein tyrosine phosphatase (PTP) superfamily phosphohydrolase (DUF442 family)